MLFYFIFMSSIIYNKFAFKASCIKSFSTQCTLPLCTLSVNYLPSWCSESDRVCSSV